ncbi:hypothetical protein ElyMa_001832000 [Elysia marginata]|uniref:Thioredoxin domain-containing protein n=1 Tax=Elysia marginata TaxID=1093978 RepID=A0AAV4EJ61_9GAST|nr:hypothetical protein ElyMa_001832000 [Elysia marginata]
MSRVKEQDKKKKRSQGRHDPFIGSKSVEGLDPRNFDDFLTERDVTMVMFYDANDPQCEWSKKHFLKVGCFNYIADINCYCFGFTLKEAEMCAQEGVVSLPTFKLFVKNRLVDTYTRPKEMTFHTIKKYIENMPVIPDPPPCARPCEKEKNVCFSKKS